MTSSYSYFCLTKKDNLCVGVSVPVGGSAFEGIYMQLKSYSKSKDKGIDNKRMRWKIDPNTLALQLQDRLALGDTLCASPDRDYEGVFNLTDVPLRLYQCADLAQFVNPPQWTFDESKGQLQTTWRGAKACIVTYNCSHGPNTFFCRLRREFPQDFKNDIIAGSYLGLAKCSGKNSPDLYQNMQTFSQDTNCTMDCSQELLDNKLCDEACNYDLCEFDEGYCTQAPNTKEPTVPTTHAPSSPISLLDPWDTPKDEGMMVMWVFALLGLVLLLIACLAKRQRDKYRANQQHEGLDGSLNVVLQPRPLASRRDKFQTSSAVALNQLRYHSRPQHQPVPVVGTETTPPPQPPTITKLRYEEVGQV
ncbi:hypothetical protein BASA81_007845 [Batrachochytrium salamandrivorans]|nr:hypothetical protein BASA81_007845 [Batrachochytrium salamandrivorans]